MSVKDKLLIFIMLILLVFIVVGERRKKRINWYPSYAVRHKIPFGSYIFHEEAKKIFPDLLNDVSLTPYTFIKKKTNLKGNYVFYNENLNFEKTNLNAILEWVEKGNNVFIFSKSFDKNLLDTLKIKDSVCFNLKSFNQTQLNFINPKLKIDDIINYDLNVYDYVCLNEKKNKDINNKIIPLGYLKTPGNKTVINNFIKISYGKGFFYLHSFPKVVTNYFILKKNNYKYIEGLFAYMNNKKNIYWDTHYQNGAGTKGIFSILIQNKSFLWAYRLAIFGILFYILFEGKRKQRAIPVVKPYKNEMLGFTKTISELYLENKEHEKMAQLKIKLFIYWLKDNLHINYTKTDNNIIEKIAEKSKTDINNVHDVFKMIDYLNKTQEVSAKDVLKLENLITKITK